MQKGDVYIINSKLKNLETVKIKDIKDDQITVVIIDGTPAFIGDIVKLSRSKTEFAAFVENDYQLTFFEKLTAKIKGLYSSINFEYVVIAALSLAILSEAHVV